jgi:hypothetical protein
MNELLYYVRRARFKISFVHVVSSLVLLIAIRLNGKLSSYLRHFMWLSEFAFVLLILFMESNPKLARTSTRCINSNPGTYQQFSQSSIDEVSAAFTCQGSPIVAHIMK